MAPNAPTGRPRLLAWLRDPNVMRHLPIRMGSPTLQVGVVYEGGTWRLRRLAFDNAAFSAFVAEEQAVGRPLYPEYAERFRHPTGEVLVEAENLESFIRVLERMEWPRDW